MPELDDEIYDRIRVLSEEGNQLANVKKFDEALRKFQDAWELLPEPKDRWAAALWITVALGDTQFLMRRYPAAVNAFMAALLLGGASNPFVHLRLGQSLLETGDRDRAADELTRAYGMEGRRIFDNEDPKYLTFLSTVLQPPAGQDRL